MKIGYARVSTDDQNLAMQLDALRAAGCEKIHEDKASGILHGRRGLTEALESCAAGDVLVVWKLDRLARSLHDLVVIAADLKSRGVGLKILTGEGAAVDTTHAQGRMIFGILAVMAEFEREMISERTVAGMVAARNRGVRVGRPLKLSEFQRREAASMLDAGKARSDIAALLGVHVGTLRRALKGPDDLGGFQHRKNLRPLYGPENGFNGCEARRLPCLLLSVAERKMLSKNREKHRVRKTPVFVLRPHRGPKSSTSQERRAKA
jgi:DNA invertase Pin-like site-specific DNA recombinase